MKKILIIAGILVVLIIGTIFVIGRVFYPDNVAVTSPDGGAKNLKTRFYKTDLETARKTVQEIIPTLSTYGSNWKLEAAKAKENQVNIRAEVPVIFFTDDFGVKITRSTEKEGEVQIDVVSKSRVGKSDFGENARHVRQFLGALDKKLAGK